MEERLAELKSLLGIAGNERDDTLRFVLSAAEDRILAYIGHDVLPDALEKILILICVSYFKTAGLGDAAAASPIASVKRGDVQTSFATASGASGSASTFNLGAENGDFFGWKTALNEYRKLRW